MPFLTAGPATVEILVGNDVGTDMVERVQQVWNETQSGLTSEGVTSCAECVHRIEFVEQPKSCRNYHSVGPLTKAVDGVWSMALLSDQVLEVVKKSGGYSNRSFYVRKHAVVDGTDPKFGEPGFAEFAIKHWRKVCDICVNRFVKHDSIAVPNALDTAKSEAKFKYKWHGDWLTAYHQLPLAEESRQYTEHPSPGLGVNVQYARVPQGLRGASQRMVRCATALFGDLPRTVTFYDNVAGGGDTVEEFFESFAAFLRKCKAHNVKIKASSLMFGLTTMPFIGHLVVPGGVTIDPSLQLGLRTMEFPSSKATVGSFARSVSWMRPFLPASFPNYARILFDYEKGKETEQSAREAYEVIQGMLREPSVLKEFSPELETQLNIDYSLMAIAGGVRQLHHDGNWYPTMMASRSLTEEERTRIRNSSTTGEMVASVWGLRRFKPWLAPLKRFRLWSDSGNLTWLKSSTSISALRARSLIEKDYSLDQICLSHVAGRKNWVDAMSRDEKAPPPGYVDWTLESDDALQLAVLVPDIVMSFGTDEFAAGEIDAIKGVVVDVHGVVTSEGRNLVPRGMRRMVFDSVHIPTQGTHRPLDVTLQIMKSHYKWRNMDRDCIQAWRRCGLAFSP